MRNAKAAKVAATIEDRLERKMATTGLNESEALKELLSGIVQDLKGESIAQEIEEFLAQFDAVTATEIDKQITRLRGITNPVRFKKQTLLLLATIYGYAHRKGAKAGHRSESARVLTKG
jgi:hypothetical protein